MTDDSNTGCSYPLGYSDEEIQALKSEAPIKQLIDECGFSLSQAVHFANKCTGESIELERLIFFIVTNWDVITKVQGGHKYAHFTDSGYAFSYLITRQEAVEELTKSIFELRMISITYTRPFYYLDRNKILTETVTTRLTSSVDVVGLSEQISIFWTPDAYTYFECRYRLNRDGTLPSNLSTDEPSV